MQPGGRPTKRACSVLKHSDPSFESCYNCERRKGPCRNSLPSASPLESVVSEPQPPQSRADLDACADTQAASVVPTGIGPRTRRAPQRIDEENLPALRVRTVEANRERSQRAFERSLVVSDGSASTYRRA